MNDVFIGRSDELAQLVSRLEDAEQGKGRVVFVTGEPGIGKTRLIEELAKVATERGANVVWGRSWDEGAAPAYWPWSQVLRAVAPVLADRLRAPGTDPDARFALFEDVTNGLRDVAQKAPLVIVLDDVHAADPSSLSLLLFVAREARSARLLVIAAYRDAEARRAVEQRDLLARIARDVPTIELPRLLDEDVRAFLKEAAGPAGALEPVVRMVLATTEGVPLFVHEMLRTLSTQGSALASTAPLPDGVRGIIRTRLAGLESDVRDLLDRASVIGQTFTVGLAAAASGLLPEKVHEAMECAARAEVLRRVAPGRYAFAHALVREVLYRDIAGGERARIHERIVDALEKSGADDEKSLLAHHALRAAPAIGAARAVKAAIAAAREATTMLAFEDARALLARAQAVLDLAPPDPALRAEVTSAIAELEKTTPSGEKPIASSPSPDTLAAELVLSCEGEVWTIKHGATVVRLKDSRGVQMLAQLVKNPEKEIHALTLSNESGEPTPGGDSGEMLDREAVKAYRARLADLEDEVREGEAWNDPGRVEKARREIEALRGELARAVGLGGRQRRAGNAQERARVNVTRRLKDAIRRIAEQDEKLGRYLDMAVQTGTFCVYRPKK